MRQKGNTFAVILVIVVLILLAAGGYFVTKRKTDMQTPGMQPDTSQLAPIVIQPNTQVDGWNTYNNSVFNYTLQYPSNLRTQVQASELGLEEASPTTQTLYIYDPSKPMAPTPYLYLTVDRIDVEPEYGEEWLKTPFTIGTHTGTRITLKEGTTDSTVYQFKHEGGGFVEIRVVTDPERNELAESIFKTFKFVTP